jgi:hypothetical protein
VRQWKQKGRARSATQSSWSLRQGGGNSKDDQLGTFNERLPETDHQAKSGSSSHRPVIASHRGQDIMECSEPSAEEDDAWVATGIPHIDRPEQMNRRGHNPLRIPE